jgi:hypothetical protein
MGVRQHLERMWSGGVPDRIPFISRLEMWHRAHTRTGTLPSAYRGLSLLEIHRRTGNGQQLFVAPYALRLRGVDLQVEFEGTTTVRLHEPVVENFPGMWDFVAADRAGQTRTELSTPVGRLSLRHEVTASMVEMGADPYLRQHLIRDEADYATVEWILERADFVPRFAEVLEEDAALGDEGVAVPLLQRIPFQQVLLEYLGETSLFYALHDAPARVDRLLALLEAQLEDILPRLAALPMPYVEFPDNLHGLMTNPRLFRRHALPAYQRYTSLLHAQGKRVGSHTDGDVRPLLGLLAESGLDVCESFSPQPLTACTFDEAWQAWQGGPLIWGGIPSPYLEERTPAEVFERYLDGVLERASQRPIILGIVDLFMRHNDIERVRRIAERLEATPVRWPEGRPA